MSSSVSVLVVGDLHYKSDNIDQLSIVIDDIIRVIKERNPDLVILAGDILDRFSTANSIVHTQAIKAIQKISLIVHVIVIIGNHDRPNNSDFLTDNHFFNGLHGVTNITVIDKIVPLNVKGLNIICAPYVETGRFIEALETLPCWIDSDIIFAHQEILDCELGGIKSTKGDKWLSNYPFLTSGHIHHHHKPYENVLYVGTPHMTSFGDNDDKTVSLLSWDIEHVRRHHQLLDEKSGTLNSMIPLEERIEIISPKWSHIHIEACNISRFSPPLNTKLKITIHGSVSENLVIKKLGVVKEWKKQGINVVFNDRQDEAVFNLLDLHNPKRSINFRENFSRSIADDPSLKSLYVELFSTSSVLNIV